MNSVDSQYITAGTEAGCVRFGFGRTRKAKSIRLWPMVCPVASIYGALWCIVPLKGRVSVMG